MKNILKVSTFFVLSLLISSLSLTAMERSYYMWIKTSDGKMRKYADFHYSDMKLVTRQINEGKGSQDNPIIVPVTEMEFESAGYKSNNYVQGTGLNLMGSTKIDAASIDNLLDGLRLAKILENNILYDAIVKELTAREGG